MVGRCGPQPFPAAAFTPTPPPPSAPFERVKELEAKVAGTNPNVADLWWVHDDPEGVTTMPTKRLSMERLWP